MSESSQDAIDKINQLASQSPPAQPGAQVGAGLADGAAAMVNGSQAMLAQAQSGTLKFDPQSGQALINNLNKQIKTLEGSASRSPRSSKK